MSPTDTAVYLMLGVVLLAFCVGVHIGHRERREEESHLLRQLVEERDWLREHAGALYVQTQVQHHQIHDHEASWKGN